MRIRAGRVERGFVGGISRLEVMVVEPQEGGLMLLAYRAETEGEVAGAALVLTSPDIVRITAALWA